jgi:hypothetical protein
VTLRNIIGWAAVAFVAWMAVENPHATAAAAHGAATFIAGSVHGLRNFWEQM